MIEPKPVNLHVATCALAGAIRWCRGVAALWLACALVLPLPASGAEKSESAGAEAAQAESSILVMIRMPPARFRPDVDYGDGYAARSGHAARRRVAEEIARTHGLQLQSHWPMPSIGVECFVMQVPAGVLPATAAQVVSRDTRLAWAQPLNTFRGQAYNDPLYDQQPAAHAWQLHALHRVTTGRGVLIGQVDSGAEAEHPDLRGQFRLVHNTVDGSRYVAEKHGTAIAGILVARANNGIGTAGVAPGAQVLALRACWERVAGDARCDTLSLAKALQFALDRGARIVNLSVSGPADRLLGELLTAALARGVIVVASTPAAGVEGGFPAMHRGVIAVVDIGGPPPSHKQRAPLAAPGRDVPTTLPGARWGVVSGASFATAQVSGLVALLLELLPDATADEIDALMRGTPVRHADATAAGATAAGATAGATAAAESVPASASALESIHACRAVSVAARRCVCDCAGEASNPAHR